MANAVRSYRRKGRRRQNLQRWSRFSFAHGADRWEGGLCCYLEIVVGIGLEPFSVVDQTGEDDDAQDEEEDEQCQLLGRRFERVDEDFEAGRVAGEFEETQDADDGEELEDVGVVHVVRQLLFN